MEELTAEEVKALALLAEGWNHADIASVLGMKKHLAVALLNRVRVKLAATNGPHAVATAIREKIIG